ncbi:MAG: DUF2971 domain-containing protein [Prolixibacteraceae bacterium]|nr:DUF2971 domain-containing protein [Prolixibacteraceae bacterium]
MNKLYKYRPLSEFLFKELYYQELYFASYLELNDPLDLSARIEFTTSNINAIEHLIRFIFSVQFELRETDSEKQSLSKLLKFIKDRKAIEILRDEIFEKVKNEIQKKKLLWTSNIVEIIENSIESTKTDILFNSEKFKEEIHRLTEKFLKSSYVTCFSETNDDFLMWSHYSSKHTGICIEFTMENDNMFPYERARNEYSRDRKHDLDKYKSRMSEWEAKSFIFWDNIRKVVYQDEQPFINFFDFAAVFENEYDCDLIGLSKSWTHKYAHELELVFSTKTKHWKYENEWRAIEINFDKQKEPEARIRHYPIESVSAIYFGVHTPETIRNRIFKILNNKADKIKFFETKFNGTSEIEFEPWEYFEE